MNVNFKNALRVMITDITGSPLYEFGKSLKLDFAIHLQRALAKGLDFGLHDIFSIKYVSSGFLITGIVDANEPNKVQTFLVVILPEINLVTEHRKYGVSGLGHFAGIPETLTSIATVRLTKDQLLLRVFLTILEGEKEPLFKDAPSDDEYRRFRERYMDASMLAVRIGAEGYKRIKELRKYIEEKDYVESHYFYVDLIEPRIARLEAKIGMMVANFDKLHSLPIDQQIMRLRVSEIMMSDVAEETMWIIQKIAISRPFDLVV